MESWERIWAAAGAVTERIPLLGTGRTITPATAAGVLQGRIAPEQVAWSVAKVERRLRALSPDVVVCVTTRAFHPRLVDVAPVFVLDLVDSLADSYAQRAEVLGGAKGLAYRALSHQHTRVERSILDLPIDRVVAGRGDDARFHATWIPIVGAAGRSAALGLANDAAFDALFFGTLTYPPNIEGLRLLERWWPTIAVRHPGLNVLVAGASPGREVVDLCHRCGWTLEPDFDGVESLCRRARVAIAPLPFAAGVQTKVLEAAAAGIPQVVTSAVLRGIGAEFPVFVADGATAFADQLSRALDPEIGAALARRARAHHDAVYRPEPYVPWALGLLRRAGAADVIAA